MDNKKIPIKIEYLGPYNDYINIMVMITDQCNYNCYYCYNNKPRKNICLDLKRVFNIIRTIKEQTHRKIFLELIGGEPCLHEQINMLFDKNIFHVVDSIALYTNLSLDVLFYQKLIDNNVKIIATWHGLSNDKSNEQFIDKILTLISNLSINDIENKLKIRIMYEIDNIINSINVFTFLNSFDKLKKQIEFSLLSNIKNTIFNYSNEQLNTFNILVNKYRTYLEKYKLTYNDNTVEILTYNDIDYNPMPKYSFRFWKCNAGLDSLYIHINGNIYPCETQYNIHKKLGNIYDNKKFIVPSKGIICMSNICKCEWHVKKERIFNYT